MVVQPEAMKNSGMWNAHIKRDAKSGIEVCPTTMRMIVIPLAMSIH